MCKIRDIEKIKNSINTWPSLSCSINLSNSLIKILIKDLVKVPPVSNFQFLFLPLKQIVISMKDNPHKFDL